MKKVIIALLSIIFLAGCSDNSQNTNNSANVQRVATNVQNTVNSIPQAITVPIFNNEQVNPANQIATANETQPPKSEEPKEEEISSFKTDILTDDDKRESNIDITCSKINNYTVKAGETFSFTETVGKATTSKGYQEADIFDANGNKTKGLGGGNCQVSSTLYNAVLEADGDFEIVERHPHSSKVYYVPDGKDATVAYGSLDFKFKNNNDFDIKIYASSNDEEVSVRLVKVV